MGAWMLLRCLALLAGAASLPAEEGASLTYLNTSAGAELLKHATHDRPYWQLSGHFVTEPHSNTCGFVTATMVLNALGSQGLPAPVSEEYSLSREGFHSVVHYWEMKNVLASECAKNATSPWRGSLKQVSALISCASPRLSVRVVEAWHSTAEEFRKALMEAFEAKPLKFVTVNFDRKGLNQKGIGHHSPIGAYDATTDRALVMDVARYRYPPAWVPVRELFTAMAANLSHPELPEPFRNMTKNLSTPRGFLVVSASEAETSAGILV
eukprot:TRINITY_DN68524_c0_g1_i1.p1 TRINITY_DN68524_c0_g1~~TRINITY_DN68524_c0_g1_i1.p1  ORF type:complete len:280 (-),score=49.11 TRINITY_DN68524_c0_g1_i1:41-841(-)